MNNITKFFKCGDEADVIDFMSNVQCADCPFDKQPHVKWSECHHTFAAWAITECGNGKNNITQLVEDEDRLTDLITPVMCHVCPCDEICSDLARRNARNQEGATCSDMFREWALADCGEEDEE